MRANTKVKQGMGRRFAIVIGVAAAGVMALGAQTAMADEIGRTEGDARASFNAEPGGGMAIAFTHCRGEATETSCPNPSGDIPNGSPTGGIPPDRLGRAREESVRIYPYASASYCASGWHVIFASWWVTESELVSFGGLSDPDYSDAFEYLNSVDIQFAWDGVPLVTERTANKRLVDFPEPGLEDVFWFNAGTFMPPGTLSVGKHRLTTTAVESLFGGEEDSVRITILPC
jgi:hypothetical protein